MSNSQTTTIQTTVGPAAAQVSFAGPNVQVNVFMPPNGGAGFFLVFPASRRTQAIDAARRLAEGAPLAENINITDQVSGALVAGTIGRPKFEVRFGVPSVAHAGP